MEPLKLRNENLAFGLLDSDFEMGITIIEDGQENTEFINRDQASVIIKHLKEQFNID